MGGWTRATTLAVAAGVPAAVAAAFAVRKAARRARRRGSTDAADPERQRRRQVNGSGRIASGEVVDVIETGAAPNRVVVYRYEVAGVAYEAAQEISSFLPAGAAPQVLLGGAASIKYDPRRPINSIIACEEWSGLAESAFPGGRKSEPQA